MNLLAVTDNNDLEQCFCTMAHGDIFYGMFGDQGIRMALALDVAKTSNSSNHMDPEFPP